MDPIKDAHLLYIAKEGLKAPLPEPWKPCQNKEGEIFYYNLETKDQTWEHPCDNYYKSLYNREKNKKNPGKLPLGFTDSSNDKKLKPLVPPIKQLPSPMFGQSTKADFTKKDPEINNNKPSGLIDKSKDPLILIEKNKKLEAYREKKEKEFEGIKETLDEEYDKKLKEAQHKHQIIMKDIQEQYNEKFAEEEEKILNEIQALENSMKFSTKSLDNLEVTIRKELEESNKKKLDLELKRLEDDYKRFEQEMENSNEIYLSQEKEKIKKLYEQKTEELDQEISNNEKSQRNDSINDFDEEAFISEHRKTLKEEFDNKLAVEKEAFIKKIELETQEEINKEMELHNKKMEELEKMTMDIEAVQRKMGEEEAEYRKILEDDFERKVRSLKEENERKLELEKLLILEKLKDVEQEKRLEIKQEINKSLTFEKDLFESEKKKLEEDFQENKIRMEEKDKDDEKDKNEDKINKIHEDLLALKRSLIGSKMGKEEIEEDLSDVGTLDQLNKEIEGLLKKKNEVMEMARERKGKIGGEEKRNIVDKLKRINERLELMMKLEKMMQAQILE